MLLIRVQYSLLGLLISQNIYAFALIRYKSRNSPLLSVSTSKNKYSKFDLYVLRCHPQRYKRS